MKERLGFNLWTKNKPQKYIELFTDYASKRDADLIAVVDDLLPEAVLKRSSQETLEMNGLYEDYMRAAGVHEIHFCSKLMPERMNDAVSIIEICNEISLSTFLAALPKHKIDELANLKLSEAVEATWHINVLDKATKHEAITSWLTGKRSTAFYRLAKTIIHGFQFEIIDK